MNQSKFLINILVLLLVGGFLVFAYFYFFGSTDDEIGISTTQTTVANPNVSAETSEFLVLLRSLQSVQLSGEIFNNPVFATELVNYTTPISDRPRGRSNPFAPLGTANVFGGNNSEPAETEIEASADEPVNTLESEEDSSVNSSEF